MPMFTRVSGAWQTITAPAVRVSGAWQTVQAGFVRVSGVWQQFFTVISGVTIADVTISEFSSGTASAAYRLLNTGFAQQIVGGVATGLGAWLTPQSGMSGYDVRVTGTGSGGTFTGPTGSWVNLSSTSTWELFTTVPGLFCERVLTVEIRDTATSTVQDTATITLQAEVP